MTVSIWQAEGTQSAREVDFLVVGAGTAERAVDMLLNGMHPGALWAGRLE